MNGEMFNRRWSIALRHVTDLWFLVLGNGVLTKDRVRFRTWEERMKYNTQDEGELRCDEVIYLRLTVGSTFMGAYYLPGGNERYDDSSLTWMNGSCNVPSWCKHFIASLSLSVHHYLLAQVALENTKESKWKRSMECFQEKRRRITQGKSNKRRT